MNESNFETRAFGGFDKQQVLDYISGLIAEQEEALAKKEADCAALQARVNELEEQAEQANRAMQEGAEALQEQSDALDRAAEEKLQLQQLCAALKEQNRQLEENVIKLQDQNSQLSAAFQAKNEENETLSAKAVELEAFKERQAEVQTKLNELLAKAHAKSDEIMQEAKRRGIAIINQANGVAAATYASCNRLKETIGVVDAATARLRDQLRDPANDFQTHLEKVKQAALNEEKPSALLERFIAENLQDND